MTTSTQPRFNLFNELDQSLNSLVRSLGGETVSSTFPRLSVYETDDYLVVECDVPGFELPELGVEFDNGNLFIRGERSNEGPHGGAKDFERSLQLSPEWSGEEIDASLLNGVLTTRLKKAAEYQPRPVLIRDGQASD